MFSPYMASTISFYTDLSFFKYSNLKIISCQGRLDSVSKLYEPFMIYVSLNLTIVENALLSLKSLSDHP